MSVLVPPAPLAPRVPPTSEHGPENPTVVPRPVTRLFPIAIAGAVGILLVALSFRWELGGSSQTACALVFWAGLLLAVLPAARLLLTSAASRSERVAAVLLVGIATGAPRFLRAGGPLMTDEYAAWRQTLDATTGSTWGVGGGFVPGVEGYPGLHLLVGSLSSVSGLGVWSSAVLLLAAAHLLGVFAVFVATESLLGRARVAGLAALLYLVNPVALYVGVRLAPDSLAVPLALSAIALLAAACRTDDTRTRGGLAVAAAVLLGLVALSDGTVALLVAGLLAVTAWASAWRTRQHPVQLTRAANGSIAHREVGLPEHTNLWLGALAALGACLLVVSAALFATGGAYEQAADWFPSRGLFGMPGVTPAFEVVLTVIAPLIVLLLAAEGIWRLWSEPRRRTGRLLALASSGVVYFAVVPLVLLPTVAPAVRSIWALTYLGVALLAAPVVLRRYDQWREVRGWVVERVAAGPLLALLLAVLLIGNTAASAGAGLRYAGPTQFGAEGRTDSAELRSVAEVFANGNGRVGVLADRYTGPPFAAYSGSRIARATTLLPGNELMQGVDPSAEVVTGLVRRGYTHLVVDVRMAGVSPIDGLSFGPDDPGEGWQTRETALLRLDRVPWVSRVTASEHYRVYRIDLGGAGQPLVEQADAWGPDFRPVGAGAPAALPAVGPGAVGPDAPGGPGVPGGPGASITAAGSVPGGVPHSVGAPAAEHSRARAASVAAATGAAVRSLPPGHVTAGRPAAAAPHGAPARPGAQVARPGAKPAAPGAKPAAPGAKPGKPAAPPKGGKPAAPPKGGKPAAPPKGGKPAAPPKGGKPAPPPAKPTKPAKPNKPAKPPKATPPPSSGKPAKPSKPPAAGPPPKATPPAAGKPAKPNKPQASRPAPGNSGNAPGQQPKGAGGAPGRSGSAPGQQPKTAASAPGRSGYAPGQQAKASGPAPGNSGNAPGQQAKASGPAPGNSGRTPAGGRKASPLARERAVNEPNRGAGGAGGSASTASSASNGRPDDSRSAPVLPTTASDRARTATTP